MNDLAVHALHDRSAPPPLSRSAANCPPALLQSPAETQFREMEHAFRASGGIVNADQLTTLLLGRTDQPISRLARWIVARNVLSFRWRALTLLPMFQFETSTVSPRPDVSRTIRELIPGLSDWDATLWFAQPNAWLDGAAPADAIDEDPQGVFDAARAHRYLVRG